MDQWYDEVPARTAPPSRTDVPPKPPLDVSILPTSSPHPPLELQQAQLSADHEDLSSSTTTWKRTVSCSAYTGIDGWTTVMGNLVASPERNSKNILRADILFDETTDSSATSSNTWQLKRRIIRRLLPFRPGFNASLDQLCSFYYDGEGDSQSGLVVYTPIFRRQAGAECNSLDEYLVDCRRASSADEIPFYHPALRCLAYTYHAADSTASSSQGTIGVELLCFPGQTVTPALQRVSQTLIKTVHAHCWGTAHAYKARVEHDRLVPRSLYQDVYVNLKHRWATYLTTEWKESTDPSKHVHEDLGIAAWLICFWRERLGVRHREGAQTVTLTERPWLEDHATWGRPKGGFVDVGCGNGLLVWLLNNEGYSGFGFDLRPRHSWDLFRSSSIIKVAYSVADGQASNDVSIQTRPADLRVECLNALRFIQDQLEERKGPQSNLLPTASFLIGNHADELTPIIPLLASVTPDCAGLLNIPCCSWQLDSTRFTQSHYSISRETVAALLQLDDSAATRDADRLLLRQQMQECSLGPAIDAPTSSKHSKAGTGSGSKTAAYLTYVSHLHLQAGWLVEKEALRIPSTKNWAVVSARRSRSDTEAAVKERLKMMLDGRVQSWQARDAAGEGQWFLEEKRTDTQSELG